MVAANAVDLVVSQLNSNETGVPLWPRMLLFPGRWREAEGRRVDVAVTPALQRRRRSARLKPRAVGQRSLPAHGGAAR